MPQIIALEISDAELRAVAAESSFRDYKVTGLYSDPRAGDETPLVDELRAFVERHSLEPETVLSVLPGDLVTWRLLQLPFKDRKKIAQTIPFEIENHIPFDLDEVVIDFIVLGREEGGANVLAGVVPKRVLSEHLEALEAAGLDPKRVDLAPLSALNFLRLVPELPPTHAFIAYGESEICIALQRDGRLVGLRALPAATAATQGNGTGEADREMDESARRAHLAEVRWTLMAMNGGALEDDLPVYLCGSPERLGDLAGALGDGLGLEIRRLDRVRVRRPSGASDELPGFSSPLGMILHEVGTPSAVGLNFRRGEFTYHRAQQELQHRLRGVAALAAVFVALMIVDAFMGYRQQATRVALLDREIMRVAAQTLPPELARMGDPVNTLQAEIDFEQEQLEIVNSVLPASNSTAIDMLQAISAAIPSTLRVELEDFHMDPEAIRVKGNADSFESIDNIKQRVMGTGFFSDVEVRDARSNPKEGGVDFRLNMVLAKQLGPSEVER